VRRLPLLTIEPVLSTGAAPMRSASRRLAPGRDGRPPSRRPGGPRSSAPLLPSSPGNVGSGHSPTFQPSRSVLSLRSSRTAATATASPRASTSRAWPPSSWARRWDRARAAPCTSPTWIRGCSAPTASVRWPCRQALRAALAALKDVPAALSATSHFSFSANREANLGVIARAIRRLNVRSSCPGQLSDHHTSPFVADGDRAYRLDSTHAHAFPSCRVRAQAAAERPARRPNTEPAISPDPPG
jgi:hypothetical protein